jgi:phage terminase large subunit GpA-like protein
VPDGAIVLTGGVDTQKGYFCCVIRAWGVYPESWLILDEVVDKWEDVVKIFIGTADKPALYKSMNPELEPFSVRLTCVDSGYRTSEVYDFCREFRHCARAIKGKDQLTGVPYKVTNIDKYPDSGRQIQGGLLLWLLDTTYFKDKISRMVHADQAASKWHLYRNPSEEYLKWFCGEHKVLKRDKKKGSAYEVWQPVSSHAQTHSWDAEVYAMAAGEMLRVFSLREEDKPKPLQQIAAHDEQDQKKKWLQKRSGWIRHG